MAEPTAVPRSDAPTPPPPTLAVRLAAEAIGTFALTFVAAGADATAGLSADQVSPLARALAPGLLVMALIYAIGDRSGAHFNPAVTLADASQRGLPWREVPAYVVAQIAGAFGGVALAHVMFAHPLFAASQHARGTTAEIVSDFVATFGLLSVIWGVARRRSEAVPFAVGAYITAAYWFTASTSFANPAVTLARAATDTFAGIRPADVPAFVVAQLAGAAAATVLFRWLVPADREKP